MNKIKCQCSDRGNVLKEHEYMYAPEERIGMNHEPNECGCTNELKQYMRGNKKLWLCSCCNVLGDVEIPEIEHGERTNNGLRYR